MRILVLEDEVQLAEQLRVQLQQRGYSVDLATDGEEGLYYLRDYPLDLAVVDIGLPKMSGIEVIRQARSEGLTLPVLILTARGNWQDKVEGLEVGADDYLVKPFHIEELLARLNALLRRSAGVSTPVIEWGSLALNTASQSVTRSGQPLELTAYEYRVLEYMMLHRGRVISKAELTDHIYEQDYDRDSNVLEVFVGRLRRKLDPDGDLAPIETLRGRGYRFKSDPEKE
ncbi:MAG: response regulator transcription factor [Gammaproteobacteria bacterium]|nr:response regulator transcription factor [Gammaproteobacteria bacterium]